MWVHGTKAEEHPAPPRNHIKVYTCARIKSSLFFDPSVQRTIILFDE
jgi:hypothetical protein